jgi:hypothetical protein
LLVRLDLPRRGGTEREGAGADCVAILAIALALTITNTLAFSRCDKFSQASNIAGSAFGGGNLAGSLATNIVGRFFSR